MILVREIKPMNAQNESFYLATFMKLAFLLRIFEMQAAKAYSSFGLRGRDGKDGKLGGEGME